MKRNGRKMIQDENNVKGPVDDILHAKLVLSPIAATSSSKRLALLSPAAAAALVRRMTTWVVVAGCVEYHIT